MMDEDKIIAYILDELDETAHQEVANAIEQDQQLQETVEQYQRIKAGFRAKRVKALAEKIADYESTLPPVPHDPPTTTSKKKNGGRFGLTSILVASILALAAGALMYGNVTYSNTALAKKHFWMPIDPATAGTQDENTFNTALDLFFTNKSYDEAANLFASIPNESPFTARAQYYEAHANFLAKNYDEALSQFESLAKTKDVYSPNENRRIEWNRMVNQLQAGQPITSIQDNWLDTDRGQALAKDLSSFWRKLFH